MFDETFTTIWLSGHPRSGQGQEMTSVPLGTIFIGLGPKFLDNGSQQTLNRSPLNLNRRFMMVKPFYTENFLPPLKTWQGKPNNLLTAVNRKCVTSKRFSTEHIDKQITDVSSMMDTLKRYERWGITLRGFDATSGKKWSAINDAQKFSAPTSSVQHFGHTGLSLWHLSFEGCGVPEIFGVWKFASNCSKVASRQCAAGDRRGYASR